MTRDDTIGAIDAGADVDDLAAEAEAEAEAAEAIAAAAQARARAARLRQEAEPPALKTKSRRWFRRPRWATVVVTLALLGTLGFVAASGYVVWQHRDAVRHQQQSAEYAAAARQIVYTLMSIDAAKAEETVAQILDNSTGQFRDEFEGAAQDFVRLAEDGKVVTDVEVKAAAVESMTADSADVLVTASSTVTNAAGADEQPRSWRLSVTVVRDGDRLKMSKMEFVA
ncbi:MULTISPECIES: hypothetical protein [Mycobacteriaceae]|uniref:hypothetical protein n=1 Tax=Mycobacteriaceae TaxID=1762 RepID=UPI001E65504E|nr:MULTISPECIES: hypothetical protein [Mycobacteriaceae]MCK0175456.1 hypothetical protein [Mycolicibacterium sp. F2034L]